MQAVKGVENSEQWRERRRRGGPRLAAAVLAILLFALNAFAQQTKFDDMPIAQVAVTIDGGATEAVSTRFQEIARDALGQRYSAVKVRDAIERLYQTRQVATVAVDAQSSETGAVLLNFLIKRKTQAEKVSVRIVGEDDKVTEQELLFRLNLLEAGTPVSDQTLRNSADQMLEYLRDRGFYQATVTYATQPLTSPNEVGVTFTVTPGEQATVERFDINIQGFDSAKLADEVNLQAGDKYTRETLDADVQKIRTILRQEDYLAPTIDEPRVVYDRDRNAVTISIGGVRGPKVEVDVEADSARPGGGTQQKIFPVKSQGTLDYSAIVEGERRLENYYQEQGYFFADAKPVCSVEPPLSNVDANAATNGSEFLCSALSGADLANSNVKLTYRVEPGRHLRLTDIRLRGTTQFTIDEIKPALETQEANILGIIPLFGYGRGYTSQRILDTDAATIRSLLRELGFRDAEVRVNQGVSPDGESLIITFNVEEGPRTIISSVDVEGNQNFTDDELLKQLPTIAGSYYSRAKLRNGQRRISEYITRAGYYDAVVDFSVDEVPADPNSNERQFKVVYNIRHKTNPFQDSAANALTPGVELAGEGKKVVIDRIMVTGNEKTRTDAVLKALTLRSGDLLRSTEVYTSEQNLYQSDAFARVDIKLRPVGDRDANTRATDVIVNVEEQAPRILTYGGGFSTDLGASGFVDLRHLNLFGRLWQGGGRLRVSQRQQLAQFDFVNPRFIKDGDRRYAPLTITAQYQRDSTVTRFFRSAFDRGTFGIVQRVDENGTPIDEFGRDTGSPTLNRLTLTAETNRTISRKDRSVVFFRYRFEDVRLYNIESLLIKDLLRPDANTRISGFGVTYVRDTRKNCSIQYTILDIIARGEAPEPCRYNATDPTNGQYFNIEYNVSLPVLGANIGFNKFQAAYRTYYTLPFLSRSRFQAIRNTTFAAAATVGLANVFSRGNRFDQAQFPDLDNILPISERFFAGGANTLRGFDFEEAGPRVVIVPQGIFRRPNGDPVFLTPFTVPFGGNALAIVNLEARIPLTKSLRAVPFYDGGNVFRRVGDIFNPPDVPAGDVFRQNLRALWTHTVGLGLRLKTPVGGEVGFDFGHLLNPPEFLIPQPNGQNAIYRLHQNQIHFRFSQAF
jgi:outer membrane protein assembly factor BamA